MVCDAALYDKRGVSADKGDVHAAIKNIDKGLFPTAFCKVVPDYFSSDQGYCLIMHADGAGTKTALAYAYWRATGDLSVWKGIAQDSLVMNIDDLLCCGVSCSEPILVSSTIGRNKTLIPREVLQGLIEGQQELLNKWRQFGANIISTGGETADVGDLVRTIIVDTTVNARMRREDVIENKDIAAGQVVIGLCSYGPPATYETEYNSGMGSNGLTSARHDMFSKEVAATYPETYDPNMDPAVVYCGKYDVNDEIEIDDPFAGKIRIKVGKLVLSPTRTYAPIILKVLEKHRSEVKGMIHCSGGGQTKILHFLGPELRVVKDSLFPIPPLFNLLQEATDCSWAEMYKVFNMGHRMELYVNPTAAEGIIAIAKQFNVEAKIIGRVVADDERGVTITSARGTFRY
eukprot:GEMP01011104.1.p1 GENE.GEMP01011104.1~~GEMP01011104.1.p1  ORF type:complete len:421 (+),score=72.20 GEMP01011104.1:58-1263(+)